MHSAIPGRLSRIGNDDHVEALCNGDLALPTTGRCLASSSDLTKKRPPARVASWCSSHLGHRLTAPETAPTDLANTYPPLDSDSASATGPYATYKYILEIASGNALLEADALFDPGGETLRRPKNRWSRAWFSAEVSPARHAVISPTFQASTSVFGR